MRKIDDTNIVNEVKNNSNYEIKTTSASILRKYHAEKSVAQENKKSKTKYFIFGGLGTLGLTAAVIATVFFINTSESNEPGNNPLNPNITIKNQSLKHELATFSLFSAEESGSLTKNLIQMKKVEENDDDSKEENQSITKESFKKVCETYDSTNKALENLTRETKIEGSEFNDKVEGSDLSFKYKNDIFYADTNEQLASIYFNDETIFEEDDDEIESKITALYVTNERMFDLTIEKEIEKDEAEYTLTFSPKFETDYYYVVEKEQEIHGTVSEGAYSYTTYFKNSKDEFLEKISYEKEIKSNKTELELEVEKNNGDEKFAFKDITINEDKTVFKASFESENEEQIDDIVVEMVYQGTARLYKYDTLEVLLK